MRSCAYAIVHMLPTDDGKKHIFEDVKAYGWVQSKQQWSLHFIMAQYCEPLA